MAVPQNAAPQRASAETSGVVESPWLWAVVFTLMAQAVLFGIRGKYTARQTRIEDKYLARENLMRSAAGSTTPLAQPAGTGGDRPRITLWPLHVCFGLTTAAALLMLLRNHAAPREVVPPPVTERSPS